MDKKQLKRIIFYITMLIYLIINVCTAHAEESSAGTYTVDYRYLPRYSLTSAPSEYINLDMYYSGDNSYFDEWQHSHTYSINGNSSVNLYTLIDSYQSNMFSIACRIDDHSDIAAFKLKNLYVYYEFVPEHIISEKLQIQGSVASYIPDALTEYGYTDVQLQARSRISGEWELLRMYQVHYGEVYPLYFYLEEGSINYDAYRIWFNYWDIKNNGWTLAFRGESDPDNYGTNICSCDFENTSEDNTEKLLEDLKELQQNTISSINSVGDLIRGLPNLIIDGIYDLFVPDDIQILFSDKVDELKSKMGILFLPFDFVLTELEYILDYNPKSTITLPELKVMNQPIMARTTYDIDDVGSMRVSSDDDWDKVTIVEIVRFFTTLLIIYSIVHLAIDLAEALFGWYMKDVHEDISPEWIDETQDKGD